MAIMTSDNQNNIDIEAIARSVIAHKKSAQKRANYSLNSVRNVLNQPREELKTLMDHIDKDTTISKNVLSCIANQFHKSITGCHLKQNRLTILVSNGAAATQLRFSKTAILTCLRQQGLWEIATIEIKVKPFSKQD